MASDILSILVPSVVTKIVSTIRTPGNVLSRHFGFEIGGKNVFKFNGRTYTYDIYNNVRSIAAGRLPGAPSGSTSMNPIGNVQLTLTRSAEKVEMDYNTLNQIRSIGENAGSRDVMGLRYITRQAKTLAQRQNNLREFMTAGILFNGGSYGFYLNGQDLVPTFDTPATGGTPYILVQHQIPSNQILQGGSFAPGLTMGGPTAIIDGPWSNPTTDIPTHLMKISDRFQANVGQPLASVFVDTISTNYILQNDRIRQLAGTSNTPFASYENTGVKNPDGTDSGLYRFRLKGIPWVEFHTYGGVLSLVTGSGSATPTNTKLLPDGYATFMIEFDPNFFQCVEGSEIVKDNDLAPPKEVEGHYAWMMEKADPARFELHNLQNVGFELNIPSAIAMARIR